MRRLGPTIGLSCRSSSISSRSSSSNCCCCNIPEGLNIQQQPCQNLNLAISLFVSLFCCLSALFLCLFHSFFSSLIIFLTSCLLHSSRLSPYLCFISLSLSLSIPSFADTNINQCVLLCSSFVQADTHRLFSVYLNQLRLWRIVSGSRTSLMILFEAHDTYVNNFNLTDHQLISRFFVIYVN